MELISVATFNDLPEAELARERLENEGVRAAGGTTALPLVPELERTDAT